MTWPALITGSQGFIGRYLTAHWLASDLGARVVGIGRSPRLPGCFTHRVSWNGRKVRAPLPTELAGLDDEPRYRYRRQDLRDPAGLLTLIADERPSIVFHLAGALRDEPTSRLLSANVLAVERLLSTIAAAAVAPPIVVLCSTGSLYGRVPSRRLPIRESEPANPIDLYGASKVAAETTARILAEKHEIPLVIARIFNVVGPGQDERHLCGSLAAQMAAIRAGTRAPRIAVGTLDTTRDFIDVRDVVRGLCLLAERGRPGGTYNVASGVETRTSEVFDRLREVAELPAILGLVTAESRPLDYDRAVADTTSLRAIGFSPRVPLRQSLRESLDYYAIAVAAAAKKKHPASRPRSVRIVNRRDHEYRVEVEAGLLDRLPRTLALRYPHTRMVVLTDDRVDELYGRAFVRELRSCAVQASTVILSEGEVAKSAPDLLGITEQLYRAGFDRRALLINLGGGVVTDVGGFAAAIYMRGVRYVNVPTTLLAQHDAAIGGKVAVNTSWAKNFLGSFHDPDAVYCDPGVLRTLEPRALSSGIAEALKVAIIKDPTLFRLLEASSGSVQQERNAELLGEVVLRSARGKARLLAPDPFERDLRRVLNLGHTFGHPLETELGYERIYHGEAVAYGIAVATAVSLARGVCDESTAERIFALLTSYHLPPPVPEDELVRAIARMEAVRLVRGKQLHFVLPEAIGRVRMVPEVDSSEIEKAIRFTMGRLTPLVRVH